MPIQLAFILPTTKCLAHCEFCYYETGHSERVEAADFLAPLERAIDRLAADGLQQVIITGGEPLLAEHLAGLLRSCSRPAVHLLLLTHRELLDEQRLAQLEEVGVDDITISANDVDGNLREAVHRIVFHSRYTPTLLTCFSRANVDRLGDLLDFSTRLHLPHLFTPVFVPRGAECFERHSLRGLDNEEWELLTQTLEPWSRATGSEFYLSMVRDYYLGLPVHPGFCPMGTGGLVIDADGSVYPCFHRHDLLAGNLLSDPWEQISGRLEQMGKHLLGAPCFGEHCLSMFAGIQA
jgi:MoaA/NifB/PqqE/SkfB family radical SAM enzyme